MQPPTCIGLRVRSPSDAHLIFHAVATNILGMVTRRLDTDERRAIRSGCVYVWEERGTHAEATGLGIERWTDSISWGPSRVRDASIDDATSSLTALTKSQEFLFYHEKRPIAELDTTSDSDTATHGRRGHIMPSLIKQTYSVFVATAHGPRKWHLIAYFTQETLEDLDTIDNYPRLANLHVPEGIYTCARTSKTRISASLPPRRNTFKHSANQPLRRPKFARPAASLAPLEYLTALPPPRRHVLDEMALMSFSAMIMPDEFLRSHK